MDSVTIIVIILIIIIPSRVLIPCLALFWALYIYKLM